MAKARPHTVPAKRPPTPDPRDVVCPHQHFKYDVIDRDILSRKQHLNLLCTPKGYRWIMMKGDAGDDMNDQDDIKYHPCRVVKKKPGKTYVHNILAELWSLLTPEMITRLKEMLMAEFGLTEEAAVDFICRSRHDTIQTAHRIKTKREADGEGPEEEDDFPPEDPTIPRLIVEPKLCDKSQFAVGIDPCHIKEFSRTVSTKFAEYVVAMMCARRNNRHRRFAEVVLNGLCSLTGEKTTLDNPKNRLHKILTITSDRIALWLAQNMDDDGNKRDKRRKKEDDALKKRKLEKQKEQERRRKEKEKMNKEIERNKKRKAKEDEEMEKQKQEEQEKKKADKEKRRQELEKFREEDKKKKEDEQKKAKEDEEKKKQEKKEKQDKTKQKATTAKPATAQPTKNDGQKQAGRDRKPATAGGDQRAGATGRDQKSGTAGREQKPGAGGPNQRPGPGGSDQKPGAGGPNQRPGAGGRPTGRDQKPGGGSQTKQPTNQATSEERGPSSQEGGPSSHEGGVGSPEDETDTGAATKREDEGKPAEQSAPTGGGTTGVPATGEDETADGRGPDSEVQGSSQGATSKSGGVAESEEQAEPVPTSIQKPTEAVSREEGGIGKPPEQPASSETGPPTSADQLPGKQPTSEQFGAQPASTDPGLGASEDKSKSKVSVTPGKPGEQIGPQPAVPESKPIGVTSDERVQKSTDGQPGRPPAEQRGPDSDLKPSPEDRILAVTASQIGDTKPISTPRQETLQDILSKELEKRVEPQDKETEEIIREVASKTATWIDQNVKDAEIEYGSRDKLVPVSPVTQKPKGALFVVKKIDPSRQTYDVRLATHTEAGQKIRALRRKASGRNVTSNVPKDPSDPKMWAKWAVNASQMADEWGHWIDKTIQDAEDKAVQYQTKVKEGITDPADEEDWNRFVEATTENALSWRRKKKSLDEAAKEWKVTAR